MILTIYFEEPQYVHQPKDGLNKCIAMRSKPKSLTLKYMIRKRATRSTETHIRLQYKNPRVASKTLKMPMPAFPAPTSQSKHHTLPTIRSRDRPRTRARRRLYLSGARCRCIGGDATRGVGATGLLSAEVLGEGGRRRSAVIGL